MPRCNTKRGQFARDGVALMRVNDVSEAGAILNTNNKVASLGGVSVSRFAL